MENITHTWARAHAHTPLSAPRNLGKFTFSYSSLSLSPPPPSPFLFSLFIFLLLFFINLFIYFWLRWVFVAARRLSLVAASGGYSSLRCVGFSLRWLLLLRSTDSRRGGFSSCGLRALERRLSSCGEQALLLRSTWDLPRPGLEPVSPALAGGFLTTAPPGKSCSLFLIWKTELLHFPFSCGPVLHDVRDPGFFCLVALPYLGPGCQ